MSEQMKENELISVAMQIILHAGDARIRIQEALKHGKELDFEAARKSLVEAKECIRLAHQSQTEVIQNETRGMVYEPSLLFNHAQDTLMTIMSENNMANEMIDMFEVMYHKCCKN
ncbi:PTS system cellobiose-specific IIA component [Breznakia blatticola]|uniref:PTS system cellobiose-specific IIA component n=1 Tax=Breznakia blatticola TaxID=1754012 RepID=A0A4R8A9E1_9FIRM|nr:PTS lactose/cellobiose transporter subunit IIA [Breznakia blatticola]TDW26321.1 PTS system cellobiose-specific IIA component [Breznakia blatticola]